VHNDSLVRAHILSKFDAFIDLAMTLQKLEDGLVAGLTEPRRMLFQEFMELFLLLHNIFLCILNF
jgi:hypothetical protein